MIAAFSAADQLRRRPAPVNTSMRRTGSGICLCSEIDMCRSLHRLRDSPFCRHANRWCPNTAYVETVRVSRFEVEIEKSALLLAGDAQGRNRRGPDLQPRFPLQRP